MKTLLLLAFALTCVTGVSEAQRSSAGAVVGVTQAQDAVMGSAMRRPPLILNQPRNRVLRPGLGRKLLQVDFSQRRGIPTGNNFATGAGNTAGYFSSVPSFFRRIGGIGPANSVQQAGSLSAADTTVVAGVRGVDNLASGSGIGLGSGSGRVGGYRGYTTAGRRQLLQRNSVAVTQRPRAGTSTSLNPVDRSAGTLQPAYVDTGVNGYGSGSTATTGLVSSNAP